MAIKLTTDLLKADFPYPFTVKSLEVFKHLYKLFEREDEKAIKKILNAADTFTDQPQFLNLAAQYYDQYEMKEKAIEINKKIEEKFPLFPFWRMNKSFDAFEEKDAPKMKELLGEELLLEKLYPERKLFHTSEYVAYTRVAVLYFGLLNDHVSILQRVEKARKLSDIYDFDIKILFESAAFHLRDLLNFKKSASPELPPLPTFHFQETEEIFRYDLNIPDEVYNSILGKDRAPLIEDLEKVLQHAVEHKDVFNEEDFDDENTFFVLHAMFLLKDLEATESLPALLHFLKQDEDVLDVYLGEVVHETLWEIFYVLGKDQLRLVVNFFKELEDEWFVRTQIVEALTQIALYHPEKRLEIESYLRELLFFVSSKKVEEDIDIEEVTDKVIEAIGAGKFNRLFPEVKKLYDEEKLQPIEFQDWEEYEQQFVAEEFNSSFYQQEFKSRKEIYVDFLSDIDDLDEEEHDDYDFDDPDEYMRMLDESDAYENALEEQDENDDRNKDYINYLDVPAQPFVKTEPDVGRNDPCPCGSGKKYKKCHGKS